MSVFCYGSAVILTGPPTSVRPLTRAASGVHTWTFGALVFLVVCSSIVQWCVSTSKVTCGVDL